MKQRVALAYPKQTVERAGWAALERVAETAGFGGFDLRVPLTGRLDDEVIDLAALSHQYAHGVRIHAWVGRRDPKRGHSVADEADGRRQGDQLGRRAVELLADSAGANAERDVYRGRDGKQHPGAMTFLRSLQAAFGRRVVAEARDASLHDLGFLDPSLFYGAGSIAPDVLKAWHGWVAMLYQRSARRAAAKLEAGMAKRRLWLGALTVPPVELFLPVGRIDRLGRVVGDAPGWLALLPGLARDGVAGVTWYAGLGSDRWPARAGWRQLVEGHARHPPLVEIIPQVAEACA